MEVRHMAASSMSKRLLLAWMLALFAPGCASSSATTCKELAGEYQWVLIFGELFPLPRELVLFGGSTSSHYFEERNYPGQSITASGAVSVGIENQYQEQWVGKDSSARQMSRSYEKGRLLVEEYLEAKDVSSHYVHMTDGKEYVLLLGSISGRAGELLNAADDVQSCWSAQ